MSYNEEILKKLSKEELIKLITQKYEIYNENMFGLETKIIYDKNTDSIIEFSIDKEIDMNLFKNFSNNKREMKEIIFLESLRRTGITNMLMSGKYLQQIGGTKSSIEKFFKEKKELDEIEKKYNINILKKVKEIEQNKIKKTIMDKMGGTPEVDGNIVF
jgi:hypothetical protein